MKRDVPIFQETFNLQLILAIAGLQTFGSDVVIAGLLITKHIFVFKSIMNGRLTQILARLSLHLSV